MLETAIESLARSGRHVRIKEITLAYIPPSRAMLSGAMAALLLTYVRYYWWALTSLVTMFLGLIGNQKFIVSPPPDFQLFVYGPVATICFLFSGALLAFVRRWTVRQGRFIILQAGAIAEFRAGWHVPIGMFVIVLLTLGLSRTFYTLPTSLGYLALAAASLLGVIAWEIAHDLILPLFASPSERTRAAIEYDLKEAFAQDETAVPWRLDRVKFDPTAACAQLEGEFPTDQSKKHAEQIARRVKGVTSVQLVNVRQDVKGGASSPFTPM